MIFNIVYSILYHHDYGLGYAVLTLFVYMYTLYMPEPGFVLCFKDTKSVVQCYVSLLYGLQLPANCITVTE